MGLRSRLAVQPRALPVRSPLVKVSKTKNVEGKAPMLSKFIANSSPDGNNAGKHAHPCAGEMGNPDVRRGRKAYRPPT
jgi:hypothetical protein